MKSRADVVIVGAGHNGLVAALLLAKHGLDVLVLEEQAVIGGAARSERPFRGAPGLTTSTGAYLLGLMPPELLQITGVELPLRRRDPYYFLPRRDRGYLLFGSDREATRQQFLTFSSERDWRANQALEFEIAALREDLAPTWLQEPFTIEETAARFVRPALRQPFTDLCRKPIRDYLERFGFESDLVVDMMVLHPQSIERYFGITGGHIHHVDNSFGFADRLPYAQPVAGLYSCSAGTHPAGSVIGCAGHNAAMRLIKDQQA